MANRDDFYEVGYRKPPRQTRFRKGRSGNPKGRPRGSQNLSSVVAKVGRERVKVTSERGSHSITKLEASLIQLANKAASGDLRAIRDLLNLVKSLEDPEQTSFTPLIPHERDKNVMASIIERIRNSEELSDNDDKNSAQPTRFTKEEKE